VLSFGADKKQASRFSASGERCAAADQGFAAAAIERKLNFPN